MLSNICYADHTTTVIIRPGNDASPVPGCEGTGEPGLDYCYEASGDTLRLRATSCNINNPCSACQVRLVAMGANTLAFVPIRYAVVGEGVSDMILVPAVLKSHLMIDTLGFQVAPGLSSGDADQIAIVNKESPRTAYLTDGDDAGRKMRSRMTRRHPSMPGG